jgi:glyoxylase-like metal-dependent hydrolase (beta-lactamase superfamily II)
MMTSIAMKTSRTALAALALVVLAGLAGSVLAQQDFSKVEIKTTKISGNVYTLEGQGGTIGALVGPDGVFMVDAQFAPLSEKIAAALKQISDGRIRFLVNTHVHGDHTGGNPNFAKMGAVLLSREELRARLAKPAKGDPPPAASLPMLTYRGPVTIRMNGEEVQLVPVPAAHTDGDTMVRFVTADVIMPGDFYRSVGYPNIDRGNGGSLNGMLAGLQAIVDLAGPNTKIIPGHGPIVDENAVTAHRNLIIALRDRVAPLVKQGKTQEEVVAAKLNADYDAKVPEPGTTGERFITQLYAELKGGAGSQ